MNVNKKNLSCIINLKWANLALLFFVLQFNVNGQNIGVSDLNSFTPTSMFHIYKSTAPSISLFQVQNTLNTNVMTINSTGFTGINVAPLSNYRLYVSDNSTTAGNAAFFGEATGNARTYGVYGASTTSTTTNTSGVYGYAAATSGSTNGVWGQSASSSGTGVFGLGSYGLYGLTNFTGGVGVFGDGTTNGFGGYFTSSTSSCAGTVYCKNTTTEGTGLYAINTASAGAGTTGDAIEAFTAQSGSSALWGMNTNTTGTGIMVSGNNVSTSYHPWGSGCAFTGSLLGGEAIQTTSNASGPGTLYGNAADYVGFYGSAKVDPNSYGYYYHFGIHGEVTNTGAAGNSGERCGGVLGSYVQNSAGQCAGVLGYHRYDDDGYYGGWFTTSLSNNLSKSLLCEDSTYLYVGIGTDSKYLGANIKGGKYGIFTEGTDFSLYVHGNEYKDGLDVHFQKVENDQIAMYSVVSENVNLQTSGTGNLVNGKCQIILDKSFRSVVSDVSKVSINITPMGDCEGLFAQRTEEGFIVNELHNGSSNIEFSYIVIGQRKNYEKPVVFNNFNSLLKKLEEDKDDKETNDKVTSVPDIHRINQNKHSSIITLK